MAFTFSSGVTGQVAAGILTSTTFVVAYEEGGTHKARIGTRSGADVTFAAAVTLKAAAAGEGVALTVMDPTHFIAAYESVSDIFARVGLVSGTDITLGAEIEVFDGSSEPDPAGLPAITAMSSTVAVVAYFVDDDIANKVSGNVLTVTGTALAKGAKADLVDITGVPPDPTYHWAAIDRLDSTHAILVTQTSGGTATIAKVVLVVGTTLSVGPAVNMVSTSLNDYAVYAASATEAVAVYSKSSDDDGYARPLIISGLDVTLGTESRFAIHPDAGPPILNPSIDGRNDTNPGKFRIAYNNGGVDGEYVDGEVGGGALGAWGPNIVFNDSTLNTSYRQQGGYRSIVAYVDNGDADKGKVAVLAVGGASGLDSVLGGVGLNGIGAA